MILRLKGMNCFGETDWDHGTGSDEIYAIMTLSTYEPPAPGQPPRAVVRTNRSNLWEDVDAGGSFPTTQILYIGPPREMALSVTCMENDNADPDDLTAKAKAVAEAAAEVSGSVGYDVPSWAPGLAAEVFTSITGGGDDNLGQDTKTFTAGEVASLVGRPLSQDREVLYHFWTWHTGEGSTYKFYFDVV